MLRRLRSFKKGTVSLCRSTGCKVTSFQSWRMILSSRNRTRAARVWFEVGRMAEFFSNLQLWQLATLQSFDLKTNSTSMERFWPKFHHSVSSRDWQHFKDRVLLSKIDLIYIELFKYLIHIHLQKMYVIYALLCFLAFSFTVQGMDCSNLDWNWFFF